MNNEIDNLEDEIIDELLETTADPGIMHFFSVHAPRLKMMLERYIHLLPDEN